MVWITAFFTEGFSPKTGLSPTLDVYRVADNNQVITGAAMDEIAGGYYKYDFTTYDSAEVYSIVADGGVTLAFMERYKYGGTSSESDIKDILALFDNKLTIDTTSSTLNLWNAAGDAIIKTWPLTDKDGESIIILGDAPANRGTRTL